MKLGFWILIVSGSTDSLNCIPDSKAQDSGTTSKNFARFPIPLHGAGTLKSRTKKLKINHHGRKMDSFVRAKSDDLTVHSVGSKNTLSRILSFFFIKDVQQARYVLYFFLNRRSVYFCNILHTLVFVIRNFVMETDNEILTFTFDLVTRVF